VLHPSIQAFSTVPFVGLLIVTAGIALAPAVATFHWIIGFELATQGVGFYLARGLGLALGFYVYGFSLMIIAPIFNFLLGGRIKPYRGPSISLKILNWYVHNMLTMLVRYTFLEMLTPTEWAKFYFQAMGMKLGKGVVINSTAISDPAMIRMDDHVTIGGSANLLGHYAQGGYLIVAPIHIKRGATIGMRAVVMGGAVIGEKAKVLANSFVLPNTHIPDGQTWAGVPAASIEISRK